MSRRFLRYDRCRWDMAWTMVAMLLTAAVLVVLAGGCAAGVASNSGRHSSISSCKEATIGASRRAPQSLSTPLPRGIVLKYAIFRRHYRPSDLPRGGTNGLVRDLADHFEVASYYVSYIRRLSGPADGPAYFVVPGYARPGPLYPVGCGSFIERRSRAEERRHRITEPIYCIVEMGHDEKVVPVGCEPFAAVRRGLSIFESNGLARVTRILLAPNGVVRQRIQYREAPDVLVHVTDNAFSFTPAPPSAQISAELAKLAPELGDSDLSRQQRRQVTRNWNAVVAKTHPTKIEWIGSGGKVLHTITPPSATTLSAISVGDLRVPISG